MFEKYEQFKQLFDTLKEKKFSRDLRFARESLLLKLNGPHFSPLVRDYLLKMNTTGLPFTDFEGEPAQISQVKKIINALYHSEVALKDAESMDFRDLNSSYGDITGHFSRLWNDTVHQTYLACELFTHFDVDLWEFFSDEIDILAPLFSKFQIFAGTQGADALSQLYQINPRGIPFELGKAGGHVIDQMGDQQDDMNYEVLTQFSAKLPGYLDQLSGMIKNFSSQVSEHEPHIDRRALDALQDQALQLLSALEQTRGSSIFLPVKTLHYIHIIRSSITLSMSIFEQAGHVGESTQDAARAKLAELKYTLLPELFGLTDKIEQQAILKPGVLSNPLMDSVSALYQQLIGYTEKFVDFNSVGSELLTLNDQKFVSCRLDKLHKRSSEHQVMRLKTNEVERATLKFYQILNKPQYRDLRLIDLPEETKKLLLSHYKIMQPHVLKLHLPMNNAIISGLTNQKGIADTFLGPVRWFNRTLNGLWARRHVGPPRSAHLLNTDSVADVYLLKPLLEAQLAKIITTQTFNVQLNDALMDETAEGVKDLKLFTYRPLQDPLSFNEATLLKSKLKSDLELFAKEPRPDTEAQALTLESMKKRLLQLERMSLEQGRMIGLDLLTMPEALMIYQAYQSMSSKLEKAEQAYALFHRLLQTDESKPLLRQSDAELKRKLCNLYSIFQPYFVSGLSSHPQLLSIDAAVVSALSQSATVFGPQERPDKVLEPFDGLNDQMEKWFQTEKSKIGDRREVISRLAQKLMREELTAKVLAPVDAEHARAHHILQHEHYSKAIADVHQSLFQMTRIFNESVRSQLLKAKEGLPFPELTDPNQSMSQSEQILGMKRLFNCLYHLEQIAVSLEALNDQSAESVYTYKVFEMSLHLRDAIYLASALKDTPALAVLGGEVKKKMEKSHAFLLDIQKHYLHESIEEEGVLPTPDPALNHSAVLYYAIDVLKILPKHITALRNDKELTAEEIATMQQQASLVTTDIERVLQNSNSYFRLFLEIPTMYRLFRDLKQQLSELTTVTHDVAMSNLLRIHDEFLTNMLIEGDRWEDHVGLVPGTLTSPMKEVFDTFYQGLLIPLGLHSKRHLAFVSSMVPIEKRELAAQERASEASLEIRKLEESQSVLVNMQARIAYYREFYSGDLPLLETVKSLIKADYQSALPILTNLMPQLTQGVAAPDAFGQNLDRILNGEAQGAARLTSIEAIITSGVSYYAGKIATHQSVINSVIEKRSFLVSLKEKQVELNQVYLQKYTEACFQKQGKVLAAKQVGFIHCSREYGLKLTTYLATFETSLVQDAQGADDIDKKMDELLLEKASQFEREHYKHYYHLEMLMAAIDRLKLYIHQSNIELQSKSSLFESVRTLSRKSQLLVTLESLATDQSFTVDERIGHLQASVLAPSFKTRLLDHHRYDSFSFAWLKQWMASFVELLGIYTPPHKACYEQLLRATKTPTLPFEKLRTQFGLFSAPLVAPSPEPVGAPQPPQSH
ncbi:MAG: hypothetical protein NTW94_00875 [Legionellales bacterium]|nr:hypothetical protein [Legionellales bacterium]